MDKTARICATVLTLGMMALVGVAVFSVAQCQRDTNIERAKAGYIYDDSRMDVIRPAQK